MHCRFNYAAYKSFPDERTNSMDDVPCRHIPIKYSTHTPKKKRAVSGALLVS